jgi:hypothetical protein
MALVSFRVAGAVLVAAAVSAANALAQAVPDDFIVKLERTSCFGECPVYTVSIDAKGNVTYDGSRFVRVEGRQTDRIPVRSVAALLDTVDRIRFFELNDRYRTIRNPDGTETMVTDLPTVFVAVTREGRSKRIEDYVGAPESLKELERQIDDTARTKRWIRLDVPTLRQLVRGGSSPSAEERAEMLLKALQYDDVEVVKGLMEIGADPNAPYYGTNTTPLMMARSAGAARALLEAGAIPSSTNENGMTPLAHAVYLAPDVTEVLLKAGVPPDQPDSDGRTALWHAACGGNVGVVKLLLDAGADPARRTGGVSALECARQSSESARLRAPSVLDGKPPFVRDFDGVITLLAQALAKRRQP